jgi:alkylhydroperoxidase family enzyme
MANKPRVNPPSLRTGNVVRDSALGHIPSVIEPYLRLNGALWRDGPLGPALIELARLRNARRVNCVFCKNVRYDIAKADGLNEAMVAQIDDDFVSSGLSEEQKVVLAFVDLYLDNPAEISPALKAKLKAHFSAAELVQLSLALVLCNTFSRFAVAMGGMPDDLPTMEISVPE